MKIGKIQRDVLRVICRCAPNGVYIGSTTRALELRGYDLEQVEDALARLARKIVVKRRNPGGSLFLYYLASNETQS